MSKFQNAYYPNSRETQEKLLNMGYDWNLPYPNDICVNWLNAKYIQTTSDGYIDTVHDISKLPLGTQV